MCMRCRHRRSGALNVVCVRGFPKAVFVRVVESAVASAFRFLV